ncbi:YidB family protein [Mesorhizobium sp. M0323]|uniref:YidB family protein n=1 Tax=Mesorhizobium sp. M0323 TaxID=2956938 RepID=UPI00333832B7
MQESPKSQSSSMPPLITEGVSSSFRQGVSFSIRPTGGLGDILDRLRNAGAGDQVDSWVSKGSNRPVQREQVEKAIDPQTLNDLAEQTGLSHDELLDRLTRELPDAVDKLTPDGQLPASKGPNLLDEIPGTGRP